MIALAAATSLRRGELWNSLRTRLHWSGMLGAVLLAGSTYVAVVEFTALRSGAAGVEQRSRNIKAYLEAPRLMSVSRQERRPNQALAVHDDLNAIISDLHVLTAKYGITLIEATFKPRERSAGEAILVVDVAVSLKGSYPDVKRTIAGLLSDHPALALMSVVLNKTRSTESAAEASLRFAYYERQTR